jgi:asparagine synthase (glutamine-hydrolysing)
MIGLELIAAGWDTSGGTRVRGYAHLEDRFLRGAELARILDSCPSSDTWQETVARLNGCFAAVTVREPAVLAAVDRLRSIPLFYSAAGAACRISDSAYLIADASEGPSVNALAAAEFRLTGYVTGRETLDLRVNQLQAGELLRWDVANGGGPERRQYYEFCHGDLLSAPTADLISRIEQVHANVFARLVRSSEGRTIVVPLSGGYDSRLIGTSLRDLGVRDVVCYSYGLLGNWEARISQELARYLGFRWEFVPYSADRWRTWAASERFRNYFHAAGNLTSVPHLQDWPAVFELHGAARIPSDSVFVPGHSGDFLAGSHIPKDILKRPNHSRREVLDAVYRAHYSLWDWPEQDSLNLRREFDRKMESIVGRIADCTPEEAADRFERWDLQERQAKFICNSVRVYEDFGYEWRLPLFDHELMDFWARIPIEQRVGRKLYYDFVRERQRLPVTSANRDRGAMMKLIVDGVDAAGLRPLAQRGQRRVRRWRWRLEYERSSLGWFAIVDPKFFRQTYSGKELAHSYFALAYCDAFAGAGGACPRRTVIPGLSAG